VLLSRGARRRPLTAAVPAPIPHQFPL